MFLGGDAGKTCYETLYIGVLLLSLSIVLTYIQNEGILNVWKENIKKIAGIIPLDSVF